MQWRAFLILKGKQFYSVGSTTTDTDFVHKQTVPFSEVQC